MRRADRALAFATLFREFAVRKALDLASLALPSIRSLGASQAAYSGGVRVARQRPRDRRSFAASLRSHSGGGSAKSGVSMRGLERKEGRGARSG